MERYELDPSLCRNLHPSLLQFYDLVSRDQGEIAGSPPVHILDLRQAEIKSGIMPQPQEMSSTGQHFPELFWAGLSPSPQSVFKVGMGQPSLIAAHPATQAHKHPILAPGLGDIAAAGTVGEESGPSHMLKPPISSILQPSTNS